MGATPPYRMFHSATAPVLHTSPPTLRHLPPNSLKPSLLLPEIPLSLQTPKKIMHGEKINESTYRDNSLYSSSTESMKLADRNVNERLSVNSHKSMSATGSGYLKMNCLINEHPDGECDSFRMSPTNEDRSERVSPPLTGQKPSEYVEVRPKIPERENKPKAILPPSSLPIKPCVKKVMTMEELADNPQMYCQEYELMSNFRSAGKSRLSEGRIDEGQSSDDVPPAVPPRSHQLAKYPGKIFPELHKQGKFQDKTKADRGSDDFVREHKCLEQYQLKRCNEIFSACNNHLRIIEDTDLIQERLGVNTLSVDDKSRSSCDSTPSQESRSQNKCDLLLPVASETSEQSSSDNAQSNLNKSNSGELAQSENKRTEALSPTSDTPTPAVSTSSCKDKLVEKVPDGELAAGKKEPGFFSRKHTQRKSSKKLTAVEVATSSSSNEPIAATTEPVAKSQSAFKLFRKKTKVNTEAVRLQTIC